jgi:hypothetical protein
MHPDTITRAWIWLVALSLGSTAIAATVSAGQVSGLGVTLAGSAILALAWAKARIILARYLGLAQAPFWHRGFSVVLGLYCIILLGLYLIG